MEQEQDQQFDITMHAQIEVSGHVDDDILRTIRKQLRDGVATFRMHVPGDLVPPITVVSTDSRVIEFELRKYVAMSNQAAAARKVPEARRRQQERRDARRKKYGDAHVLCEACGDSTYWTDDEGNSRDCEVCQ